MSLDDLPSRDEVLYQDEMLDNMDALLVDERDRHLIRQIESLHNAATSKVGTTDVQTIGILYGAWHMRAVMRFLLDDLKYRVADAEWITVFDL